MSPVLMGEAHGISVVDFKPFLDGSAKQEVSNTILDSFKRVGFVYIVNHEIPTEKIREMFDWVCSRSIHTPLSLSFWIQSKRFFAQPTEVKMLAPHPPSGTHHRGLLTVFQSQAFEVR